ncbi:epimerase [Aeromicrobium sp. Root495]|uniref:NAD-dependent epimerase/dehydratase family protein n=1 Tax=Aeromicrobium sp. Root495 TaxID=1736550 RepID=UPI0006FAAE65|nr:NAD-dependent epimerase/dehydratase family protein [Aeromicrobium sp. Root495]KQY55657.1 epimerase [Aeromicrobium sp. Root495]
MTRVLVTGASGYLGSWVVAELVRSGADVRATVRTDRSEASLRDDLRRAGLDAGSVEVVHTSLTSDEGWRDAAAGIEEVHHVAAPMILGTGADEVVIPARDGTLRVLGAARDAGVRRVVMTSSFAAIGYSPKPVRDYTEDDWTDPETPGLAAYPLAKTVQERAAWDFLEQERDAPELVVINPTWIAGPSLGTEIRSSLDVIDAMLSGTLTVAPPQRFGIVDVRDVAALHLMAMATPAAAGRRYLALADGPTRTFADVGRILRDRLGPRAEKVAVALAGDEEPPPLVIHNDRARHELGFRPRAVEDTIAETGEDVLRIRSA